MDRIKDVKQIRLQKDQVLLEVVVKKSIIIKADEKGVEFDHCKILVKGEDVRHLEVGDIVLDIVSGTYHDIKIKDKVYLLVRGVGIKVAVPESNFININESKILS